MSVFVSYLLLFSPLAKALLSAFHLVQFTPFVDEAVNVATTIAGSAGGVGLHLAPSPKA